MNRSITMNQLPLTSRCQHRRARRPFRSRPNLVSILTVAAAVLAVAGCKDKAPTSLPPPIVQVTEVTLTDVRKSTENIGQLDSPQNVEVRARVEAFVEKMLFTEGTEVKEGDPLFALDDKPFRQRLTAANGVLAKAKAALHNFEVDVKRLTPAAAAGAVSQQDLDTAVTSVEAGKANVISAQAEVEAAELDVGYCDVRAAVSGLIGAKQVSVGELVGKGEPTLLATISTLDPIWFYCNFSEVKFIKAQREIRDRGLKIEELPITLILADGSEHPDKGRIVFLDRAVDVNTGTLRARAEFSNPDKVLRPGMFGRIKVDLGVQADSILVPERALTELQGKNFVWVVDQDNKASQRPVTVGDTVDGGVMILEGLKAGERLITEGLQKVREGMPVQPKTAAQITEAAAEATKHVDVSHAKADESRKGKE